MSPSIIQIQKQLYQVNLPVPALPGFEAFICSFVHTGSPSFVVDVGPGACGPMLLSALAELGIGRPDLVLLTHIHIDHAGAASIIARQFPGTPIVCHPKAMGHLADPDRLWQGTLKTLGNHMAQVYQSIEAVPAKSILSADQLHTDQIRAIPTPGHAPHHFVFLFEGKVLFAGEAMGVSVPVGYKKLYLRPATPPRFFMDTFLESLETLADLRPQTICFGHADHRSDFEALLEKHRHQILSWKDWIAPWFEAAPDNLQGRTDACVNHLLTVDPLLADFQALAPEDQQRERHFLGNSIAGYWGYLADQGSK